MAHLIDKDALVAEIERRMQCYSDNGCEPNGGKWVELISIKHFIDTLEVKEVDLDEYLDMELSHYGLSRTEISRVTLTASAVERIIRNAFELGLKVNNKKEK